MSDVYNFDEVDNEETEETTDEANGGSSATDSNPYESTGGEEEEEAPVVATSKRGRGRPPKSASVKMEGEKREGATPKRGRGRPPKSASGRMASVKMEEEEGEGTTPSFVATTWHRGRNGRGRAPKWSSRMVMAKEEKMDSDEEGEEVQKKGRGRSRKSASGKTPTASARKEEGETATEGEDEGMDTTPAMARRGRGRPPGSGVSVGRKRKAASSASSASSFMGEASVKRPLRNVVDIPELDAEEQLAADHPEGESANLVPGARVYAVHQKVFYPALVGERDGLGRYMVEFIEDKIVRPVPPAGVVPLAAVSIDKECLFRLTPDDEPIECIIHQSIDTTNAKEWQEGVFKVVNNDGNVIEAEWTQLQLDLGTKEWKKYVNMMTKKATKIDADNIASSSDKRDRRSRVFNDPAVDVGTPGPTALLTRKTPSASASASASASVELMPTASLPETKPLTLKDLLGPIPDNERAAEAAAVEDAAKEDEEEEEGAESVESESSDAGVFFDHEFILTSANRTNDFPKKKLKRQIRERGGVVLEDINNILLDDEPVLIANAPCRTYKYLGALARGIPCVSHEWLVESVKQEQLLPYDNYKLPAGKGLLDNALHPLPDVRGKLLAGRSLMIHSKMTLEPGVKTLKETWSSLVEILGGSVVSDAPLENWTSASSVASLPEFDVLLTDSSCQLEIVRKLEAAGKAVVGSEWLIQSIITGNFLEFSAHRRFRFDSGKRKTGGSQEQPVDYSPES